jgi:hypothetical protein
MWKFEMPFFALFTYKKVYCVVIKLLYKNYHYTKHDILHTIKTHIAAFAEGSITSKNKNMKKLQKSAMKKVLGGKLPPGEGCRCTPVGNLLDICFLVYPQSVWNSYCNIGKRYECFIC